MIETHNFPLKKPELLAPGGSFSKAVTALQYGADAVYIGGTNFGLRANADNFTPDEIRELIKLAKKSEKKVYVTLNILPRTAEIPAMCDYAEELAEYGVHGIIVADPGAFTALRRRVPALPIHVSTQANTLNAEACLFWHRMGAERANLARELSLAEIREIRQTLDAEGAKAFGLEIFVHGAMCMAYSGRCMLSDYLAGRSSNRGDCAQPCRWNYHPHSVQITEENRPDELFTIEESERGTFLFNSKDLCLLEYLPQLITAGAASLKIEGRMKSDFYVAVTVRAYRIALDFCFAELQAGRSGTLPELLKEELLREVTSVSHRAYTTGFFTGKQGEQIYTSSSYIRESDFVGIVQTCTDNGNGTYTVHVSQRGNFGVGETVEFVSPTREILQWTFTALRNADGENVERAAHAVMDIFFETPFPIPQGAMMRRFRKAKA